MRVALLSHNACAGDAIGNQVAARAAFLRARGDEVRVVVESNRRLHPDLAPITRVASASEVCDLAQELRGVDLLIVDYGQYYPLLDVLPLVAGGGPRVLLDYHGVTPPSLWDGPAEALREGQRRRGLVWHADQAIVHSRFMRDELCRATGYPPERTHVEPLWFAAAGPEAGCGRLRSRLGLADERLLLFVGRLAANKRVPVLIEALALLGKQEPAVHAAIIGDCTNVYHRQFELCRRLAADRGLAGRVHFLGHVSSVDLADAYRSADLFVMPSLHEGCCIPVLEAMAAGLPVVAARAAGLPETIAGAGLSFTPDDAADLARQVERVLAPSQVRPSAPRRLAVIAPRYGPDVLGGAEQSLRLIAETLAAAGHCVEVFTTGRGTDQVNGVRVHRFAADPVDAGERAKAIEALQRGEELSEAALAEFLRQTCRSTPLLEAYAARVAEFDACIAGPFGAGLTCAALALRPERTLLMPCFHREPLARQPALAALFARVGGLLFHSEAERRLSERDLGISHPNSTVIGTYLPPGCGNAERGRRLAGHRPYLLYAGRACREKNVPLLLEWLQASNSARPERFRLVLIGETAPGQFGPAVVQLGFLSDQDRADVIAGAAALVQLSTNESLSLAALQAWNEGVPVIAHADCDVLRDFIHESGAGALVSNAAQFAGQLDDLGQHAATWRDRGRRGRDMVQRCFGSREQFADRLEQVLGNLERPLASLMRERGLSATDRMPARWEAAFARRVEAAFQAEPVERRAVVRIERRSGGRGALRLTNSGTVPLWHDGPLAARVRCQVVDSPAEPTFVPLPQPLLPGQTISLVAALPAPAAGEQSAELCVMNGDQVISTTLPMRIPGSAAGSAEGDESLLADIAARLSEAEALVELPTGYEDVSEGPLARWKHAVKRKLLHQFQASYVDVLSRQQTALNRAMLAVVRELAESTAMLGGRPVEPPRDDPAIALALAARRLKALARRTRKRIDALERRLEVLEQNTEVRQ